MKKYRSYSSFISFVILVLALPCVFFWNGWGSIAIQKPLKYSKKSRQSIPIDTLISNLAYQADTIGQLRLLINHQDSIISVQGEKLKAQHKTYILNLKE